MARKVRDEQEGAIYHVINRGDGGEAVFKRTSGARAFANIQQGGARLALGTCSAAFALSEVQPEVQHHTVNLWMHCTAWRCHEKSLLARAVDGGSPSP